MHTINVIDPNTGQAHAIPYDQLPDALESGGQFADEEQKKKAIQIQNGTYEEKEDESKPLELTLTKERQDKGADWRGLASDTIHMLGKALRGGTAFALRAPGNIKEIGSELIHHPLIYPPHIAQQVLAGLGEGVKGLANIIPEFSQELEKRNFTSGSIPSIPENTGVEKFFGLEPTKKSDELLRAFPELATALSGGRALASQGKRIFKAPDLKKSIRETQAKVNAATEKSGKIFDEIENTLEKKGKNIINVDAELIDKAKSMLSNKFNNIINKARTGDYKSLRKLQSALGEKERKGLSSKNLGDIDQAENIGVVRDEINDTIQKHLENNKFSHLAEALNKNRKAYADIKNTYFSTPQLAKVFGKSQKVPAKPMTLLSEESAEMKKFMAAHPEVQEALAKALKHESKMKKIKAITGALGIGTSAEIARKLLGGK